VKTPALLLISPGILRWEDVDFGVPHLVSIGGYVQEHTGVRVEILDLNYEGGDRRDLERKLDELGPFLLIGVSAYSSFDWLRVLSLARFLRARHPGVPLVTGGYHASALPHDLLPHFDVVIPGEAELGVRELVETLLGGGQVTAGVMPQRVVAEPDSLPPYRWELLARYWPHATQIGRKLQMYLARGCPYRCAFCMERAKSGYSWRPFSPERALDELERLSRFTPLGAWTINLADPLFGFRRRWRREVLEGIVRRGLLPLQYWTLTRSDDLDDEDVRLLASARFSIGIGLESGSPTMLRIMQKGNQPDRYLQAVLALARRSQRHGLNWAVNLIVGHPGETPETAAETLAFVEQLFLEGPSSHGWLSVDPFRLYPGSQIHEQLAHYEQTYGARFHHPRWWTSWYDGPFRAQHLDPSREMDYAARVRWMFGRYGPLVRRIHERFVGPEGPVGRIFARSQLAEIDGLRPEAEQLMLSRGARVRPEAPAQALAVPIGLDVRDPLSRALEEAIRARLDRGMVIADSLLEALFSAPPWRFLDPAASLAMLADRPLPPASEGELPASLGLGTLVVGLQALAPSAGERAVDLTARSGHLAALLAELVGPRGEVWAVADPEDAPRLQRELAGWPAVRVVARTPAGRFDLPGPFDLAWLGAAVPRVPEELGALLGPGGRAVAIAGPRFRDQDLLLVTGPEPGPASQRILARVRAPVLGGPRGWVPPPRKQVEPAVRFARWLAPAVLFEVLACSDLGADVAGLGGPRQRPMPEWAERVSACWPRASGRLALQALGLMYAEPEALLRALRSPPGELGDEAGRALCAAVADGVQSCLERWPAGWPTASLSGSVPNADALHEALSSLREGLWSPRGLRPPPLLVLDVPALGPRARATRHQGLRRVATSLAEPMDHALMQILHEEMHEITDPLVQLPEHLARDTRPDQPGFEVHRQLEQTAIAATAAYLEARAPERLPAFTRWLEGFAG
jgi:anaerobic magnesium-protoporphyrin IX monomethyl ester cyclase